MDIVIIEAFYGYCNTHIGEKIRKSIGVEKFHKIPPSLF